MKKTKLYKKFALSGSGNDTLVATSSRNCEVVDGKLRTGVQLKEYLNVNGFTIGLPSGVTEVKNIFHLYIRESGKMVQYLAIFSQDYVMYYYDPYINDGKGAWLTDYNFGVRTAVIETQEETGAMRTYFCNEKGVFYYVNTLILANTPKGMPVGCFHRGRVFVYAGDNKIVYSGAYGFSSYKETYEESGYVRVPAGSGTVCAMVPFGEYIYVFCERGIYEFYAVGRAREFVLKTITYTGDYIFGCSARECTNGIYFLTATGVCVFDGNNVKRIYQPINVALDTENSYCHAAAYEGKYHVGFLNSAGERTSVIIDCETGAGYEAFAPMGLSCLDKQGVCVYNGEIKKLSQDGNTASKNDGEAKFITKTDLGEKKCKTLVSVRVNGKGMFRLRVVNASNLIGKILSCLLEGEEKELDVGIRANEFLLMFEPGPKAVVEYVCFDYQTIG